MKKIFLSKHRTLEYVTYKSAATLLTIAATFYSIIIETRPTERTLPNMTKLNHLN